jgi:hypothetical protein
MIMASNKLLILLFRKRKECFFIFFTEFQFKLVPTKISLVHRSLLTNEQTCDLYTEAALT